MRWTVPNILTVFRLFAALGVPLSYIVFPSPYADWIAVFLFISASLTDYLDGYLARKWDQVSKFGKMLDPIADKAMVVIALTVLVMLYSRGPDELLILIPVVVIMFREIFVSGLREFLGADASDLKVTKLAKWKTTVQMIAIVGLMLSYSFGIEVNSRSHAMDIATFDAILAGVEEDYLGIRIWYNLFFWCNKIGLALLWLAALLTLITGIDYFRKSLPYLREDT